MNPVSETMFPRLILLAWLVLKKLKIATEPIIADLPHISRRAILIADVEPSIGQPRHERLR
jgi:hypothetical protein